MCIDIEKYKEELSYLFNQEKDKKFIAIGTLHPSLEQNHKFDLTYMQSSCEGSPEHPHTRIGRDDRISALTKNIDVPIRLFEAALHLYADSAVAYHEKGERNGDLHYYPPIILTFWSGFETFVRLSSELLIATVPSIPCEISSFLREEESCVNSKGEISTRSRPKPVLDRYAIFLKYAYNLDADRGSRYWQRLEKAKKLRNYYTHLDVNKPRSLSSDEVLEFMEAILLGIIWPSSLLQRTLLIGIYHIYEIWAYLKDNDERYVEHPKLLDWHIDGPYMFHCNFENVDTSIFPNMSEVTFKEQ